MGQLNFASTLFCNTVEISTANNSQTGTGTLSPLLENAGSSGFLYGALVMAKTTTVVSCVRFWRTRGGVTRMLMPAIAITAQTITNAGPAFSTQLAYPEETMLMIPIISGDTLSATMAIDTGTQTVDVMIWGALQ